jgi:GDP-D-mannose dehydratase
LVNILRNRYIIFGLVRNKIDDPFFHDCIIFDKNQEIEYVLKLVNPDIIFHLASLTNSEECTRNKIQTLEINGILICKIIDKMRSNCKIINASSCEIYKGNGTYEISEDDTNYKPTHPYAFAKLLAHQMVKYYREIDNKWTANAILFTTESPFRKDTFLIKKCINHIKEWKSGFKKILKLGDISSYRNINHAYDIANALILISEQDIGGDYLVCGDDYLSVKDIIINLYREAGLNLIQKENSFSIEGEIIIEFNCYNRTFAEAQLNGKSEKLNKLGWKRCFSGNKLFKDLLL